MASSRPPQYTKENVFKNKRTKERIYSAHHSCSLRQGHPSLPAPVNLSPHSTLVSALDHNVMTLQQNDKSVNILVKYMMVKYIMVIYIGEIYDGEREELSHREDSLSSRICSHTDCAHPVGGGQ